MSVPSPPIRAGSGGGEDGWAREALRHFGWDEPDTAALERLPQGIKNVNYRVQDRGAGWVLKAHPAGAGVRLRRTHPFEQSLAAAGVPVAPLQTTTGHGTFVESEGGVFTLHGWVRGRQIGVAGREVAFLERPTLAGELGAVVGLIHRTGAPLVDREAQPPDIPHLLGAPMRTVASISHGPPHRFLKVARVRARRPTSGFDRWVLEHLTMLRREARSLAGPQPAQVVPGTDVVLAHNDLNWENLILDDDWSLAAVLDFDNAAPLPRALDVGAAAAVLIGSDGPRFEQFLDSYQRSAGTQVDRAAVLLGMRWKCLRSMLWSVDAYLSGRVQDPELVLAWCSALDATRRSHSAG